MTNRRARRMFIQNMARRVRTMRRRALAGYIAVNGRASVASVKLPRTPRYRDLMKVAA